MWCGPRYERLLQSATRQGAHVWDVHRDARAVVFRMHARDFAALRAGARMSQCRVRILQKSSARVWGRWLAGRAALPVVVAVCAIAWLSVTGFV